MSITTIAPSEDLAAERWRQWQLRYAAHSRKSATRARIVFTRHCYRACCLAGSAAPVIAALVLIGAALVRDWARRRRCLGTRAAANNSLSAILRETEVSATANRSC
jgi:hypothetical protein